MQNSKKEWSILIYANGNNELEPEISKAKASAEAVGSNENVNVVMQIGKEDRNLARLLRPFESIPDGEEAWTGVRRYIIGLHGSQLIETLGSANMADAAGLYHFIIWAAQRYPAKHYLLIIGGHGHQFVGCMTDYSGSRPTIMGIPELCNAIDLACGYSKMKIDLLLMDTCYFNFIEVLYELGKSPDPGVRYMLTYIINGPLVGFPYDRIISTVQNNCRTDDMEYMIEQLINGFDSDLVAFRINHPQLSEIKNRFSDLAKGYNALGAENKVGLPRLFLQNNRDLPLRDAVSEISTKVNALILRYKRHSEDHFPLINIANKPTKDKEVMMLYDKLAFARDNFWTELLYSKGKSFTPAPDNPLSLKPVMMSPKAVYAYISVMNPHQSFECKKRIFENLVRYKAWR